ncbi:MAG: zinc ribbon domain-containing protein [Lachnospiraceae bacterium]|nr:zinc ribbon domain-containing protein [Lachnospiraceae bacterium]
MQKFDKITDAAACAGTIAKRWFAMGAEGPVDYEGLLKITEVVEKKLRENGGRMPTFLCSKEGALGVSYDYEYNAQWLIIPFIEGDQLERDMSEKFSNLGSAIASLPLESLKELAREIGVEIPEKKMADMEFQNRQIPPNTPVRFCRNCGKKISPGNRFCTGCGRKIN